MYWQVYIILPGNYIHMSFLKSYVLSTVKDAAKSVAQDVANEAKVIAKEAAVNAGNAAKAVAADAAASAISRSEAAVRAKLATPVPPAGTAPAVCKCDCPCAPGKQTGGGYGCKGIPKGPRRLRRI